MAGGDARLDGLVAAYQAAFDGWCELADALGADGWATSTGCPGWDVKDQLAHVVSVERRLLGDPPERAELPDGLDHVRNDFARAVEIGVHARRFTPPDELREEAKDTFERRLEQLRSLDPAWLDESMEPPVPLGHMRGAQLLRTRIYDVTTHEFDARRAVGRADVPRGPHVAISVEFVLRGWARVLPNVVDGDPVVGLEVDGARLGRLHLGDGQFDRSGDGPDADAMIGFTAPQLLAVAGGRSDAPDLEELDVRGDLETARAVLEVATITP